MPSRHTTPFVSPGASPLILRTDPRWFLTRGIACGLLFPLLLRAVGAGRFGLPCAIGVAIVWLVFRNSYITLDSHGFTYHSVVRCIAHSWVDVERFCVVEQRIFGFIPVSRYLGWNYSPAYKNYKRLAIPRTLAGWVGTDATFEPMFSCTGTGSPIMNEHLQRARTANGCCQHHRVVSPRSD